MLPLFKTLSRLPLSFLAPPLIIMKQKHVILLVSAGRKHDRAIKTHVIAQSIWLEQIQKVTVLSINRMKIAIVIFQYRYIFRTKMTKQTFHIYKKE